MKRPVRTFSDDNAARLRREQRQEEALRVDRMLNDPNGWEQHNLGRWYDPDEYPDYYA